MTLMDRNTRVWTLIAVCLVVANGAGAQISSINSVILTPRVFDDFPSAVYSANNSYPGSITIGESGTWRTNSGGLNRDLWQFSNNGSTAYTLGANDFFTAMMTVNVTGSTTVDNEAGFLVPNSNANFPSGADLNFLVDPNSHFVGMFGGSGFWNSGFSYTAGTTYTLGMRYFYDTANSSDAFQFWVNNGSTTAISPVQDFTGNLTGTTLDGYYQLGNGGTSPGASGQAVFGDISLTVPEPSALALLSMGLPLLAWRLRRRR